MIESMEPRLLDWMIQIRRDLHQHPELGWQEFRTASKIESALQQLGLEPRRVRDTGVVADLAGPEGVRMVALRADTDALPIQEETGLPYASVNNGIMHACGHDAHAGMVLGAAALLVEDTELPAPVRLIFQPAEELATGAAALVEDGVLDGVGAIFGGHVDRHYPTGTLVIAEGIVNATTDEFRIVITGQEAHAAKPHEAVDAVVVGSLIVMAIQTIVSREIDPAHPSVVSVGRFDAGSAHNVIAGQAVMAGTIRAHEPEVREHLRTSLHRVCDSVAQLHMAHIALSFEQGTPALINESDMADLARRAGEAVVGAEHVRTRVRGANMGGEDFSWYLPHVPGCYIRLGARLEGREGFPAHSSRFEFDEGVLAVGAAWFREIAHVAGRSFQERNVVSG